MTAFCHQTRMRSDKIEVNQMKNSNPTNFTNFRISSKDFFVRNLAVVFIGATV